MFTKEKLERWIDLLESVIKCIKMYMNYKIDDMEDLENLKHTLEKLYTTMTKED